MRVYTLVALLYTQYKVLDRLTRIRKVNYLLQPAAIFWPMLNHQHYNPARSLGPTACKGTGRFFIVAWYRLRFVA